MKATGTALNIKVLKPANVKGTRWIPHHEQAAKAIKQDWPCLLAHLDSVSVNGQSADAKAKPTGFVRLLRSFEFVYFLHFLLDLCQILVRMSHTSVENVTTCVATTLSGVRALGTTPGSKEAAFLREVGDGTVYKGQELRGDRDSAMQNVSRNKQAVLDAIAAHLQCRFSSFENEDIFKNMSIFNFKNWPLGLEELQVYGNEQLLSVVDHFEELLIRNDCDIDSVPLEWVELKIYIHTYIHTLLTFPLEAFQRQYNNNLKLLKKL